MPTASLNNRMRNKNRMAGISQQSLAGRYLGLDQKEEGEEKEKKKEEYRPSLEETASDTGGSVPTRLNRLKNEENNSSGRSFCPITFIIKEPPLLTSSLSKVFAICVKYS